MKKLLTVLLTVMLAFTTFTVNVLADDGEPVEEVVVENDEPIEEEEVAALKTAFTVVAPTTVNAGDKVKDYELTSLVPSEGEVESYTITWKYKGEKDFTYKVLDVKGDTKFEANKSYVITNIHVEPKGKNYFYQDDINDGAVINDSKYKYNWHSSGKDADLIDNEKSISVTVVKTVTAPEVKAQTYDGKDKTGLVIKKEDNYVLADPQATDHTNTAKDAGTYYVDIVPKAGYVWSDTKGTEVKSIAWTINPLAIDLPKPNKLEYSGEEQKAFDVKPESLFIVLSGGVGTEAGDYTAVVGLKDTNHVWKLSGTETSSEDQEIAWSIAKKKVKLALSPAEKAFANKGDTAEIQVVNYKDGMQLEYCLHDGTFSDIAVTKIDGKAYIYLPKGNNHYHVRVKEAGNYTHDDHAKIEVVELSFKGSAFVAETEEIKVGDSSAVIKCSRDYYYHPEADKGHLNDPANIAFDYLTIVVGNNTVVLRKDVDYSVAQGSTDVTFKKAYLDTLSVGEYEVGFHYKDGMHVEGKLIVKGTNPAPKKKDYVAPKTGVR